MCSIKQLRFDLKAMDEGTNALHIDLGDDFFEAVGGTETKRGNVGVDVDIKRAGDYFELHFTAKGIVHVPCDLCLDDMEQPIDCDDVLMARLSDTDSNDDGDVVMVDRDNGVLDAAWFVYETIALGIPIKHEHAPGKCNPEMTRILSEHQAGSTEKTDVIDPRWSKLAKLKNNN